MIRWDWLVLAYTSLFVYGLADNVRGPIFPDILKEFTLSDSVGSLFFFLSSAAAFTNNVIGFKWMERIGAYRTIQVYTVLQVLSLILLGFSTQYWMVLLASALLGISTGGLGIAQNVLTAVAVTGPRGRQAMSGLHCMYGVASLLAPLFVTFLYGHGLGWRASMGWISIASVLVLAFSLSPWSSAHKPALAVAIDEKKLSSSKGRSSEPRPWKVTIVFASIIAFYVVAEIALSSRLVLVARRESGYSVESANGLLTAFFVALFLGRLLFAAVSFPWKNSTVLTWSAIASAATFGLGLMGTPAWFIASGFAMSMFYPCLMNLISEEMGGDAGFVIGWCVTAQDLGLVAMHFMVGALSDLIGLRSALWIGPLALILSLILLRTRKRVLA